MRGFSPDRFKNVIVSVIFAKWIPLGIPRCNCNARVFPRNCYPDSSTLKINIKDPSPQKMPWPFSCIYPSSPSPFCPPFSSDFRGIPPSPLTPPPPSLRKGGKIKNIRGASPENVIVSVIFAKWIPLGIPRCNCNARVFPRNCYISRELIRLGIQRCNCNCNSQENNSPKQKKLHVIILMTRVVSQERCERSSEQKESLPPWLKDWQDYGHNQYQDTTAFPPPPPPPHHHHHHHHHHHLLLFSLRIVLLTMKICLIELVFISSISSVGSTSNIVVLNFSNM